MEPKQDSMQKRKALQPSTFSVIATFLFGFLLMGLPVLIVMDWPSGTNCTNVLGLSICQGTRFYRATICFPPYPMLIGAVLVGYNIKRLADWNTLELDRE